MDQTETIGIVGGGQLGRMLTLAAIELGYNVVVIDPGENCPAKQVGAEQIVAPLSDPEALQELAKKSDYITVEIEHVDTELLAEIDALGVPVNPAPQTIAMIQDKYAQKIFLEENNIPVAPFIKITDEDSAYAALEKYDGKMLLKTRRGAYDGRGNMVIKSEADIPKAFELFKDQALYAEAFVPFKKELAVMVARGNNGQTATYPVVETIQERNICIEVLAPAAIDEAATEAARNIALHVAEHLSGTGVFGIEMFLTEDGNVTVNEIAPRVHNSGHYTTEACETSQFEQHIRAIAGLKLGSTNLVTPAAVMLNVLGERDGPTEIVGLETAAAVAGTNVHLYGKSPTKIDRKMGHITAVGDTLEQAHERAYQAKAELSV